MYSAKISSNFIMLLTSVVVALAVSLIFSMFKSLASLTVFIFIVACLIILFSVVLKLFNLKEQLGSWQHVSSYFNNLNVANYIHQAMLTNCKSQIVDLPQVWVYKSGRTLVIKMSKTGVFSDNLPRLEELIGSALQGRYHDYAVVESQVDPAQNYLIFICENVNVDQTFTPKYLDDFNAKPYQLKLQNDLLVDLNKKPHIAIWGRTGSGKTTVLYYIVGQLFSSKSNIYIADGKQEFIGLKNFYVPDHVAEEPKMILGMLRTVAKEMEERQYVVGKEIKRKGVLGLTAEELGLKPVVVIVDEVASILAQLSLKDRNKFIGLLMQIVQKGRSAGVFLVVASQSPATDVLPNSIRSQFGIKILLGSATDEVQRMAFGCIATGGDVPQYTGYYLIDGQTRPKKFFVPKLGEWANLVTFERLHERR